MLSITILVDSREKTPLPFPSSIETVDFSHLPEKQVLRRVSLVTKRQTLETADYLLADEPGNVYSSGKSVIVETKRSLSEIAGNVLDPHKRRNFISLLSRMRTHPHALLVVEGGLSTLYSSAPPPASFTPISARDHFLSLCLRHGVHPYLVDGGGLEARRRAADFVARLLILGGSNGSHDLRPEHPRCPGGDSPPSDALFFALRPQLKR